MPGVDGVVQVAPDSTGKKLDTTELTRADSTVVERQRAVLADRDSTALQDTANVMDGKQSVLDRNVLDVLVEIREEIRDLKEFISDMLR